MGMNLSVKTGVWRLSSCVEIKRPGHILCNTTRSSISGSRFRARFVATTFDTFSDITLSLSTTHAMMQLLMLRRRKKQTEKWFSACCALKSRHTSLRLDAHASL